MPRNSSKRNAPGANCQVIDWPTEKNWLIAGTRIVYDQNGSEEGEIIHHYGCSQRLISKKRLAIPVYRDQPIPAVVRERQGLVYLQTLFDTVDDADNVVNEPAAATVPPIAGGEAK